MRTSEPYFTNDPYCPVCSDALEKTLRFRVLEAVGGDTRESIIVRVVYCDTCGVALGQLQGRADETINYRGYR